MRNNNLKALVVAVGLLATSGSTLAGWQNGGGVVHFGSGNPEKIIYQWYANPYNNERTIATDKANYDTWAPKNYPNRSYKPAGYTPGISWTSDALDSAITTAYSGLVWKNVGTTSVVPLTCAQNRNCGEIAQTITKDKCTSRDFGLGISGSNWKSKIKYKELLAGLVNGTFSTGLSTCTGSSIAHTCYAGDTVTPSATKTYATIEMTTKWAYARLTPTGGKIWEGSNGQTVKNICAAAGGSYRYDTFIGESFCTSIPSGNVSFEKYELFPTSNPSTASCRVTGIESL
jgi:hypothetical protein